MTEPLGGKANTVPSLRQTLQSAGLPTPFSVREDLETHPASIRELLRVLQLPVAYLDWDQEQQLWEKTHNNIQGLACIDGDTCVITSQTHIFLARSTANSRYSDIVRKEAVADLTSQTDLGLACDHFSDPDHRNGLIFFVFDVDGGGDVSSALFACDLTFRVVGYTKIGENVSSACCAFHPWNGLLYLKEAGQRTHRLLAHDVGQYFARFTSGDMTQWGTHIDFVRHADQDIALRDAAGQPSQVEEIQGMAFSPNGRLYLTHWHDYGGGPGPWENYLSIYSTLSGRFMWSSGDVDYEGDYDEIEGISLFAGAGEVFFVHADNDWENTGTDEYFLHRLRLPPALITAAAGDAAKVV